MVVIVDYEVGNAGSIRNMLKKVGVPAEISSDPQVIRSADRLILPGVGAFDHGMRSLHRSGLVPVLEEQVFQQQVPILGICLGMQMLGESSEEGNEPGLGWIKARTRRFRFDSLSDSLRVPHMGWNWVQAAAPDGLFEGYQSVPRFYFVHSLHVDCEDPNDVLATADYGFRFTCAVRRKNVFGTQFHPEKSHRFGMQLLRNFASC